MRKLQTLGIIITLAIIYILLMLMVATADQPPTTNSNDYYRGILHQIKVDYVDYKATVHSTIGQWSNRYNNLKEREDLNAMTISFYSNENDYLLKDNRKLRESGTKWYNTPMFNRLLDIVVVIGLVYVIGGNK